MNNNLSNITVRVNAPREVYIIIGNGFDIECELPTSYPEFLDFLHAVDMHFQNIIQYNVWPKKILEKYERIRREANRTIDLSKWENMSENFWYQHFQRAKIQKGWIDFENEISRVIDLFEAEIDRTPSVDQLCICNTQSRFYTEVYRPLEQQNKLTSVNANGLHENNITYRQLRDILLDELHELTRAFDLYLQDFAEIKSIEMRETISNLFHKMVGVEYCRVLSFNYTKSFERLISEHYPMTDIDYCHVHGMVGTEKTEGNLVLGIDEKSSSKVDASILLAPFKKYWQRIYKNTERNHVDWIRDIEQHSDSKRELYIFGHSIGITDKDILQSLIMSNNMKTTVYSHDDRTRADQISNMQAIIGVDNLIEMCAGTEKRLKFVGQRKC